jgi:hypothetical protein
MFVAIAAAQHVNAAPLGTWTTASLSVARESLAATSLPNDGLAIFAGGYDGAKHVLKSLIAGVGVYGGAVVNFTCATAADR